MPLEFVGATVGHHPPNTTNATTWACPGGAMINPVLLRLECTPPPGFTPVVAVP